MDNIYDYIVKIIANTPDGGEITGIGFFVDGYFITAGHVINKTNYFKVYLPSGKIGKHYEFCKDDAIIYSSSDSEYVQYYILDIAIFRAPCVESPIKLSFKTPQLGTECFFYTVRVHENSPKDLLTLQNSNGKEIVDFKAKAKIKEIQGTKYKCFTQEILKGGDSGCPVLDADKNVIGVLCGGKDETIAFQPISVFKELLSK